MRRNTVLLQQLHDAVGHAIVNGAFSGNGALFKSIERRCIVFVIHNYNVRIIRLKYFFGFSFIQLF